MHHPYSTRATAPPLRPARAEGRLSTRANPWALWRLDVPREPEMLTVAELAECRCPDLCDRDHANE